MYLQFEQCYLTVSGNDSSLKRLGLTPQTADMLPSIPKALLSRLFFIFQKKSAK